MSNATPLLAARKQQELSQEELATRAGVHRLTVSRIEAGGAHCVKLSDLRAIAKALGVDWREIHGAGVPLLAATEEDLAEITAGHEVRSVGDPTTPIAELLDQANPEHREFLDGLREFVEAVGAQR